MKKLTTLSMLATLSLGSVAIADGFGDFETKLDSTGWGKGVDFDTADEAPFLGSSKKMMDAGPAQLVKGEFDLANGTVTLPLHQGSLASGETVWYIVLDASDAEMADSLGVNYSWKLANVPAEAGRTATGDMTSLVFDKGGVDFTPVHSLTPGEAPNVFPPAAFQPGAVGDADYSPYAKLESGVVVNAPTVAFNVDEATLEGMCDGEVDHAIMTDRTVNVCPSKGTITLAMTQAISNGHYGFFISPDSSADLGATLEAAIHAPRLANLDFTRDDDAEGSAVENNAVWANGQTGAGNPERQGIVSAIMDGFSPLDTLGEIPTLGDNYSPAWAIWGTVWTPEALENGTARRLVNFADIQTEADAGNIVGLDGGTWGPSGFMVNCPMVFRVN